MFEGVNYVGIGVSDMKSSLKFYGETLGFTKVLFDYSGELPSMKEVTGRPKKIARCVMLENPNTGPLGLGKIKLVQLLSEQSEPATVCDTTIWGDIGMVEVCLNCSVSTEKVFAKLWKSGVQAVLTPAFGITQPYGLGEEIAYIRDPDNGLIELTNYHFCRTKGTEPNSSIGIEPAVEGVNHVAFGVTNLDHSAQYYQTLGFTELIEEIPPEESLYSMATMLPTNPPKMRVAMFGNYYGAWIEPIQLMTYSEPRPSRKAWGHLGPMEFAIRVTNIDKAYDYLQLKGFEFYSEPICVNVDNGEWWYVYLQEPDGLYVSLVEPRY